MVADELLQRPSQMMLIEDDEAVPAFLPDGPDPALRVGIQVRREHGQPKRSCGDGEQDQNLLAQSQDLMVAVIVEDTPDQCVQRRQQEEEHMPERARSMAGH